MKDVGVILPYLVEQVNKQNAADVPRARASLSVYIIEIDVGEMPL